MSGFLLSSLDRTGLLKKTVNIMETMKNNAAYYNLQKIAFDLKEDLKHLKRAGVDPRCFLAGKCYDYVSQVERLVAVEKRQSKAR
jgi:hypothetical protein